MYDCIVSPLHRRSAGSGVQIPSTDIPSGDIQVAPILLAGTYLAWVAPEDYLSTSHCADALDVLNDTILRGSRHKES